MDYEIKTDNINFYHMALKANIMKSYMIEFKYLVTVCDIEKIVDLGLKCLKK